jgi:hypothetical protein
MVVPDSTSLCERPSIACRFKAQEYRNRKCPQWGKQSTAPVPAVPPPGVADRRHDPAGHQAADAGVVSRHAPAGAARRACPIELGRRLGISTNAAWRVQHKLMQAVIERDRRYELGATRPRLGPAHLPGFVQEGAVIDVRPHDRVI